MHRKQALATAPTAIKAGQQWTGAELEQALRNDIPVRELAVLLGRTYEAVVKARRRATAEPKWIKVVGATDAD